MRISRASEYGIRLMLFLAKLPEGTLSDSAAIAAHERIPAPFLGKLITTLVRGGLLRTQRGAHGGVGLARGAGLITLRDILAVTEGLPGETELATPTTARSAILQAQQRFLEALANQTLAALAREDRFVSFLTGDVAEA